MRPPRSRSARRTRRLAATATLASVLALAGACTTEAKLDATSGTTAHGGSTTSTASTVHSAGSTPGSTPGTAPSGPCVTDPDAVIARKLPAAATTAALPSDLVAKLDAAGQESFKEAATPGAIVGVRTPEGTWTTAYGEADPATKAPMAVGMHTRIGSVTKTFTGTAILQLVQEGKVGLDDVIEKYVPGVPNGNEVTIRQLADMTSGVASYTRNTDFTDVYFAKPETVWTPQQLLDLGIAKSPLFPPGERFDYSNTNTVLLGMVIEKVTGEKVEDVFQKEIYDKLGMKNTSWPGASTAMPTPYPQGFTLQGNAATRSNPSNATNWNPSWGWTAGEMISNMDDLLTYGRALGTGQGLLDAKTQHTRLTSFPGPAGYGLAIGCIDGWVGHTGELPGYNTSVFYDTTEDTTVIVQVNSDIASGNCEESPTLEDDPGEAVCRAPATRLFVALSDALGHPFTPAPST